MSEIAKARDEHEAQLSSRPETPFFNALRKVQSAISNGFIHRWAATAIADGTVVVDAACGDGRLARVLGPRVTLVGVDFVERLARRAHAFTGAPVAVGDVHALGVRSRSADVVTCFEVLEHLDHPDEAIGEFARIVKPGGTLLLSVPNDEGLKHRLKKDPHPLHHSEMDYERVVALVGEHFIVEEVLLRGFWFLTPGPVSVQLGLPGPKWLATNILVRATAPQPGASRS